MRSCEEDERQATDWEKIFADDMSEKKTEYIEFSKFYSRNPKPKTKKEKPREKIGKRHGQTFH